MAMVYQFVSPALESPEDMSLEYDGAAVQVVFYDALGAQVNPVGQGRLFSKRMPGQSWLEEYPFAADEWRFNGPCLRVRLDLSGVTGYVSYRVYVWRVAYALDVSPSDAYTGEAAQVMLRDQAVAAYLTWYSGRIDAPFTRPPL